MSDSRGSGSPGLSGVADLCSRAHSGCMRRRPEKLPPLAGLDLKAADLQQHSVRASQKL